MVLIVPIYELDGGVTGVYYNSAAVIDQRGEFLAITASTTSPTATPASGRKST